MRKKLKPQHRCVIFPYVVPWHNNRRELYDDRKTISMKMRTLLQVINARKPLLRNRLYHLSISHFFIIIKNGKIRVTLSENAAGALYILVVCFT